MQSPKRPNVDSQLAPLSVVQADVDAMQGAASNIGALHPAHNQLDKLGQLYQTPRKLSDRALERSDSEILLIAMQSISQQQHLQLISCSKGLKDKLNELREINARIQDLCTSAKALLQNFGNEDARFRIEIKAEIESLEQFKGELLSIEALRERLRVEKEKVHDYENRIETVRNKIERHELEEARNRRMSWRARLLWGLTAIIVIFWLLATAGNEGEDLATIEVEHIKLIPSISLKLEEDLEYLDLDDSME